MLVKKKDGSYRVVNDFRELNNIVRNLVFPFPLVTDILDSLAGAKIFSVIDMKSAYFQLPISKGSRGCTAFSTRSGHSSNMCLHHKV